MASQYTAGLTAGQVLTAATMNSIGAAWETFDPVLVQSNTLTKTTNWSRYARINKIVHWSALFQFTNAGTAGNLIGAGSLPVAASYGGTFAVFGSALFYDVSVNRTYLLTAGSTSGNNLVFWYDNQSNFFGALPAVTVANGDWLSFTVTYQAA